MSGEHTKPVESRTEEQNPGLDAAFPITPPMDGGQAAPGYYCQQYGLTKRELFAAMAMQNLAIWPIQRGDPELTATKAVEYADALLKELAK